MNLSTKLLSITLIAASIGGCATSLNSVQKQEYQAYQARGLAVEEKEPVAGAFLGLLPGFGSFYAREYGFGIVNLLFWPLSILWDPISGYEGSLSINYFATKAEVTSKMGKELRALDDQLVLGTVTKEDYVRRKREIEITFAAGN